MIRGPDRCDCLEDMLPGSYCLKRVCPNRKKRREKEQGPRMSPEQPPKNQKPDE